MNTPTTPQHPLHSAPAPTVTIPAALAHQLMAQVLSDIKAAQATANAGYSLTLELHLDHLSLMRRELWQCLQASEHTTTPQAAA